VSPESCALKGEHLGQLLRQWRTELEIPRSTLFRRIGVSTEYLWLVAAAQERTNGEPSRPGQQLLSRLAAGPRITAEQYIELLRLAGHDRDLVKWSEEQHGASEGRGPTLPTSARMSRGGIIPRLDGRVGR